MNASLSLPPSDDLDTKMRMVARNLAQGIYEIPKILEFCQCTGREFYKMKEHPTFLAYLKQETEAWNKASNHAERTRLKAGIAIEEWIPEAYAELKDRKQGLNHRVELAKLMAKLAGFDNAPSMGMNGGGGGGFSLQINIAPGHSTTINAHRVQEFEEAIVEDEPVPVRRIVARQPPAPEVDTSVLDELEDDSALFSSPDTLGDL